MMSPYSYQQHDYVRMDGADRAAARQAIRQAKLARRASRAASPSTGLLQRTRTTLGRLLSSGTRSRQVPAECPSVVSGVLLRDIEAAAQPR